MTTTEKGCIQRREVEPTLNINSRGPRRLGYNLGLKGITLFTLNKFLLQVKDLNEKKNLIITRTKLKNLQFYN